MIKDWNITTCDSSKDMKKYQKLAIWMNPHRLHIAGLHHQGLPRHFNLSLLQSVFNQQQTIK